MSFHGFDGVLQSSILKIFDIGVDKRPSSVCTARREVTKSLCAFPGKLR